MKGLLSAAFLVALPSLLSAQNDPVANLKYPLNQRVRLTARSLQSRPIVGRVAGVDSQVVTLTVTETGTSLIVPLGDITSLHASTGIDRRTGVRRGALAGLAAGALLFGTTYPAVRDSDYWGLGTLSLGLVSFAITPGIGALVGHALAPEAWEPLVVPDVRAAVPGLARLRMAPDEPVRVKSGRGSYSGRVQSQTSDHLSLSTGDGTVALRWAEVRRVSVRGESSRRRGAIRGAVIATAITAVGVVTDPLPSFGENAGVVAGNAAFGAAIGLFFPMRSWTHLPIVRGTE